jgi:dihydrofolate reductase
MSNGEPIRGPNTLSAMGLVTCQLAVSLDGYLAGPAQSLENPLGEGGRRLHGWLFNPAGEIDAELSETLLAGNGAYILGRNMFDHGRGDWDPDWTGWWGDDPPYHAPTFVLTHHERAPLPMQGGTTFHFVTDGIESALAQAKAAAGDLNVAIGGGASTVRQFLAAGLLDEMYLHIVPVILGSGERLLDDVGDPNLEIIDVVAAPSVTHIKYRVVH